MGFLDKAKAAASDLAAKADTALASSGLGGPGGPASPEKLLRDLGVLAYLEATGPPGTRRRARAGDGCPAGARVAPGPPAPGAAHHAAAPGRRTSASRCVRPAAAPGWIRPAAAPAGRGPDHPAAAPAVLDEERRQRQLSDLFGCEITDRPVK